MCVFYFQNDNNKNYYLCTFFLIFFKKCVQGVLKQTIFSTPSCGTKGCLRHPVYTYIILFLPFEVGSLHAKLPIAQNSQKKNYPFFKTNYSI